MSILQRLRLETSPEHEALERRLPLLDPDLTLGEYRRVIQAFHSVVGPLEARLDALALPGSLNWPERRRAHLLARDLDVLAAGAGPVAESVQVAEAARDRPGVWADLTPAGALGACYVLEGSTLGGQVISRQLRRLGLTPERGGAYFAGHGPLTGERWKAFGAALCGSVPRDAEDEVLAGARRTFAAFGQALA